MPPVGIASIVVRVASASANNVIVDCIIIGIGIIGFFIIAFVVVVAVVVAWKRPSAEATTSYC